MVAAATAAAAAEKQQQQQQDHPGDEQQQQLSRRETETEPDLPAHRQVIITPLLDSPAELARSVMGDPAGRSIKLDDDPSGPENRSRVNEALLRPVVF